MSSVSHSLPIRLEHITGRVISESRLNAADANPNTNVDGPPQQGKTITEFWLACDTGGESCFTMNGNLPIRPGHYISLIKAHGPKQTMTVALANHTTNKIVHMCSSAHAVRWLGTPQGSMPAILGYTLCALFCLPIWFLSSGNIVLLAISITVCAGIAQYFLSMRSKNRNSDAQIEFRNAVTQYANQVRTAVSVLGESGQDMEVKSTPSANESKQAEAS